MKRAERLAAMLWPHRIMAIMVKTFQPKPRVELRSVVMTVDDEETVEDRPTTVLDPEDRWLLLAHWDGLNSQGAPHYWRDYELHHISSTTTPEEPDQEVPADAGATLAKPVSHTFVSRLLARIGVHA